MKILLFVFIREKLLGADSIEIFWIPTQLPGALASLGSNQLRKLDQFNEHRGILGKFYAEK